MSVVCVRMMDRLLVQVELVDLLEKVYKLKVSCQTVSVLWHGVSKSFWVYGESAFTSGARGYEGEWHQIVVKDASCGT